MSKPADSRLRSWLLGALAATLLPLASPASATVTPITAESEPARPIYQLRCWQEGRLVFEENQVSLPPGKPAAKLVAIDRTGQPMYLVESTNATCLLRYRDERADPRPVP